MIKSKSKWFEKIKLNHNKYFPFVANSSSCSYDNGLNKICFKQNDILNFFSVKHILITNFVVLYLFQVGKGWLRDLPEDLDMFIAQRDFERAMELIDRSE